MTKSPVALSREALRAAKAALPAYSHQFSPKLFTQHGGLVPGGFHLEMWAASGMIYYTLDGNDPRLPGTSPGVTNTSTLVGESVAKRVLVPTGPVSDNWRGAQPFDDSAWMLCTGGPGGIGYERSSGYEGLISLNVAEQMYGNDPNNWTAALPSPGE